MLGEAIAPLRDGLLDLLVATSHVVEHGTMLESARVETHDFLNEQTARVCAYIGTLSAKSPPLSTKQRASKWVWLLSERGGRFESPEKIAVEGLRSLPPAAVAAEWVRWIMCFMTPSI